MLAAYKTKKEGLNMHIYFALHAESSSSQDVNKDIEALHNALIQAVTHNLV